MRGCLRVQKNLDEKGDARELEVVKILNPEIESTA
jgi:hypothetical protein